MTPALGWHGSTRCRHASSCRTDRRVYATRSPASIAVFRLFFVCPTTAAVFVQEKKKKADLLFRARARITPFPSLADRKQPPDRAGSCSSLGSGERGEEEREVDRLRRAFALSVLSCCSGAAAGTFPPPGLAGSESGRYGDKGKRLFQPPACHESVRKIKV